MTQHQWNNEWRKILGIPEEKEDGFFKSASYEAEQIHHEMMFPKSDAPLATMSIHNPSDNHSGNANADGTT